MRKNPGRLPKDCVVRDEAGNVTGYRRVRVVLFNGHDTAKKEPAGWPAAGGRPATDWSISDPPHPFQIREYEVI